ncbi:MAG: hypothetical protein IT363_02260 [Methanoregulaceae archaeon]|nr:hypothetical protein [Methanoregulaceae archaeon]
MTRIARFLGVLWSLLWRATLLAIPLMLLFVAGMAVLLAALVLPPIWAYGLFFSAPWWQGTLVLLAWLAVLAGAWRLRHHLSPPQDRYRNGAI